MSRNKKSDGEVLVEETPDFESNFDLESDTIIEPNNDNTDSNESNNESPEENPPVVTEPEFIKVKMNTTYGDFGKIFRVGEVYEVTKKQYAVIGDYCVRSE